MTNDFDRLIAERSARIGIVGLGYVGLPLAVAYANAGFHVVGVDVVSDRVDAVNRGESYLMDIPTATLGECVRSGLLAASSDYASLAPADVIFVCVPTPFDRAKDPDLSFIENAARSISEHLRHGQLVLLESTTYPGTTEEVLIPILERSGLRAGSDFSVAFSPERIDPGNRTFTIANTPKVVGGIDDESARRATLVLQQVVTGGGVHQVSTPRAAELTKLLENTFRAVNIALVNELAMLCDRMGIDVWEVIDAARTKPYGFMPFVPGPGVGGHCIPVDPYYLSWKAREYDFSTKFIEIAAETNLAMPFFTVEKLRRVLLERDVRLAGAKVLVLGAAFKPDIDDARNSSAVRVMEILSAEGAEVRYHDPHVPAVTIGDALHGPSSTWREMRSVPLEVAVLDWADAVVVLVAHDAVDYQWVVGTARFVFDAVNVTGGMAAAAGRVIRL